MLNLLRAELLKTHVRPLGWMLFGLSAIVPTLFMLLSRAVAGEAPVGPVSWTSGVFLGPRFIGQLFGGLMLIVFGAGVAGVEYSYDTWKNLLTRHSSRPALIAAKWCAMLLCVAGAVAALGALSLVAALALGLVDPGLPASPGALALLGGLAVQTIALTIYGGVALLGAVAWRSSVAGIIAGFVWLVADSLLATIVQTPAWLRAALFIVAESDLYRHLGLVPEAPLRPAAASAAALAVYLGAPLLAATLIFGRRDIAGAG